MEILNYPLSKNYNYSKINFSANPQKIVKQTAPKISVDEAVEAILNLFNKTPDELLPHHKPIVASSSNKILGITVKTAKNNDLSVTKVLGTNARKGLRYLSFAEKNSKGKRLNTISIDLENNEFLKLGFDNKPIVRDDSVLYYSEQDLKAKKISKKFNEYINLIFTNNSSNIIKQEATFVNKSAKTPSETDIDAIVDKELLKQLDKEFKNEFNVIKMDETPTIDYII